MSGAGRVAGGKLPPGALHPAPQLLPVVTMMMLCALLLLSTLVRQTEYSLNFF